MKTILVTGVAGFIGSKLASELIKRNYNVVGVDNLSTGNRDVVPDEVVFIQEDTFSSGLVNKLNEYVFEAIFHVAGQSSAELSYFDPVYDVKSNVESTVLLLNYCVQKSIGKFIFTSSATVYGEQINPLLLDEKNIPAPISFYAIGKLASEEYLRLYSSEYKLTTTALRLFNVYGPGQNLSNLNQGMVSIFLAQAINDKKILVKGSPSRFRDFIYINDVVAMLINCLDINNKNYNLYNVCSGKMTRVLDVIDAIKKNIDYNIEVVYQGKTRGDIFGQTGSNVKILEDFPLAPLVEFEDGMQAMVMWAKDKFSKC